MNTKEYNGWTNYETWVVNLWMSNDQPSQGFYAEMARHCFDGAKPSDIFTKPDQATLDLSKTLKDYFDNESQDQLEAIKGQCSVWADLLNAALSEVNWHEIAEHLVEAHQALVTA